MLIYERSFDVLCVLVRSLPDVIKGLIPRGSLWISCGVQCFARDILRAHSSTYSATFRDLLTQRWSRQHLDNSIRDTP